MQFQLIVFRLAAGFDGKGHGAFGGVFDSVVEDVHYHLPQAHFVPNQGIGNVLVDMHREFQPFLAGLVADHIVDIVEDGAQAVAYRHNLHLAGFDFGKIQNVIDDGKQGFAGALDIKGVFFEDAAGLTHNHLVHA